MQYTKVFNLRCLFTPSRKKLHAICVPSTRWTLTWGLWPYISVWSEYACVPPLGNKKDLFPFVGLRYDWPTSLHEITSDGDSIYPYVCKRETTAHSALLLKTIHVFIKILKNIFFWFIKQSSSKDCIYIFKQEFECTHLSSASTLPGLLPEPPKNTQSFLVQKTPDTLFTMYALQNLPYLILIHPMQNCFIRGPLVFSNNTNCKKLSLCIVLATWQGNMRHITN